MCWFQVGCLLRYPVKILLKNGALTPPGRPQSPKRRWVNQPSRPCSRSLFVIQRPTVCLLEFCGVYVCRICRIRVDILYYIAKVLRERKLSFLMHKFINDKESQYLGKLERCDHFTTYFPGKKAVVAQQQNFRVGYLFYLFFIAFLSD